MIKQQLCTVEGCERIEKIRLGMCGMHYQRMQRHGSTDKREYEAWNSNTVENVMNNIEFGECWNWRGLTDRDGYAIVGWKGRQWRVHRLLWTLAVGEIEDGLHLDHLCEVKSCVNPDHMEPVTPMVNSQRRSGVEHGKCKRGHDKVYKQYGKCKARWICLVCMSDQQRAYQARKKAEVA